LVLGSGPDKEYLENLTKDLMVEKRVKFLGLVDHKVMPKYLKVSDVFIRPSLSEGFGNSFIEAMAAEIPVVATQEGGIADFLFDSEKNPDKKPTGWAVDKRDPEGIARAIKRILDNPEQTKRTIETAKKMVFEKYDWNIIARDMEDIFKKITQN
jgi:glycosyltransferase involved in cell wall biosynthesis